MLAPVTLAGYTARWRFRDAHLVSAWLASRPWDEGTTRVTMLRVPAGGGEEMAVEVVRREVRAFEPDAARLRIEVMEVGASFEVALRQTLELPPARTRTEELRQAGRILGTAYWVFVIRPSEGALAIRDEAQEFFENCTKVGERPTSCIVVLQRGALLTDAKDLSVGCLADGILQESERGVDRLWRAYVASRVAWESAGDIGDALALDGIIGEVGHAADGALEQALNAWAMERLAGAAGHSWTKLKAHLQAGSTPDVPDPVKAQREAELRGAGLLWRPVGEQRSRPVPWVARAILLHEPGHAARHSLRAALVNGPLANEVLRRCFDLESALVASAKSKHQGLETQLAKAQELLARYLSGQLQEGQLYPPACPAVPRDAWAFASLGEVLKVVPGMGRRGSPAERLLRLRNAMSHGHYVSWKAVREVLEVEEELAEA